MKYKALAVLAFAGVLGISGAAFAGANVHRKIDEHPRIAEAKPQPHKLPPRIEKGQRPEMPPMRSRDMHDMKRPPMPPKGLSRDREPPMKDNNMPPPPKAHSRDKRPPERRK